MNPNTCIFRAVLNIKWWQHIPNIDLYGNFPTVGDKVAARRMSLVGHFIRHPDPSTKKVLLWEPTHRHRKRGRHFPEYLEERCRIGEYKGT